MNIIFTRPFDWRPDQNMTIAFPIGHFEVEDDVAMAALEAEAAYPHPDFAHELEDDED